MQSFLGQARGGFSSVGGEENSQSLILHPWHSRNPATRPGPCRFLFILLQILKKYLLLNLMETLEIVKVLLYETMYHQPSSNPLGESSNFSIDAIESTSLHESGNTFGLKNTKFLFILGDRDDQ